MADETNDGENTISMSAEEIRLDLTVAQLVAYLDRVRPEYACPVCGAKHWGAGVQNLPDGRSVVLPYSTTAEEFDRLSRVEKAIRLASGKYSLIYAQIAATLSHL